MATQQHPPVAQYAPPLGPPPPEPQVVSRLDDGEPAGSSDPPPPYAPYAPPPPSQPIFITLSPQSQLPTHKPLDPPPSCFSTPSPIRIKSKSFAPFVVPSASSNPSLLGGFAAIYPPDLLGPHGITPEDWGRFLADLGTTSRLAGKGQSALSERGAVTLSKRGIGGLLGSRAVANGPYDSSFARSPVDEVNALVAVWNESAFERRKIKVSLRTRDTAVGSVAQGYELFVEAL